MRYGQGKQKIKVLKLGTSWCGEAGEVSQKRPGDISTAGDAGFALGWHGGMWWPPGTWASDASSSSSVSCWCQAVLVKVGAGAHPPSSWQGQERFSAQHWSPRPELPVTFIKLAFCTVLAKQAGLFEGRMFRGRNKEPPDLYFRGKNSRKKGNAIGINTYRMSNLWVTFWMELPLLHPW